MNVQSKRQGLVLTITLLDTEVLEIQEASPTSASERDRQRWETVESKYGSVASLVMDALKKEA